MRTYLIDLENVQSFGLQGISELSPNDEVYLFHSDNAKSINITIVKEMVSCHKRINFIKLFKPGTNAMDFQIITLLGVLIGRRRRGDYYIVSGDTGYDAALHFISKELSQYRELSVRRVSSIAKSLNIKERRLDDDLETMPYDPATAEHVDPAASMAHAEVVSMLTEVLGEKFVIKNIDKLIYYIGSSKNKNDLHNTFCTKFGQKTGTDLYKSVQPIFAPKLKAKCKLLITIKN